MTDVKMTDIKMTDVKITDVKMTEVKWSLLHSLVLQRNFVNPETFINIDIL